MSLTEAEILGRLARAGLKPPQAITLAVTNRCNLNCRHCWPESGPEENSSEVPINHVRRLIDGFAALGIEKIVITGGEPLTHPDWYKILSFACTRRGIREVRLQTNAILIAPSHVEAFLQLKDNGLIIQTSLEGAQPATHDRVRGPGSFDQTLLGLRLLQKNGMTSRVCITFTEMRHNFEEIPDLMKMADEMGIDQFVSGTLVSSGRAAQTDGLAPPSPHQYQELLDRYQWDGDFRDRYNRIGNIAALEWFLEDEDAATPCCTFIENPYINARGRLYPCVMLHAEDFAATTVFNGSLLSAISENIDAWSRLQQIRRSRTTQIKTCKECKDKEICGSGCIGRAFSAHGNFLSVEDRCLLRKAVYHLRRGRKNL